MNEFGKRTFESIHAYKGELIDAQPPTPATKQTRERRKTKNRARNAVAKASRKANRGK